MMRDTQGGEGMPGMKGMAQGQGMMQRQGMMHEGIMRGLGAGQGGWTARSCSVWPSTAIRASCAKRMTGTGGGKGLPDA